MDYHTLQYELDKQKREKYMLEAEQEQMAREALKPASGAAALTRRAEDTKHTDF